MSDGNPFEGMPDGMWRTEWVAIHTDFEFPEVSDADFLAEFKKVMIEVAGDRFYDYRAAEQVDDALKARGLSCPLMEEKAASEGYSRYSKIKGYIQEQMEELCLVADQWAKRIPREKVTLDGVSPELIERFKRIFRNAKPRVSYEDLIKRDMDRRDQSQQ